MIIFPPLESAYMLTRGVEGRLRADFPVAYHFTRPGDPVREYGRGVVYRGERIYIDLSDKNLRHNKMEQYRDDLYNSMCEGLRNAKNAFYNTFILLERPDLFVDNNWVMLGCAGVWVTDIDVEDIQPPANSLMMPFPAS